MKNLTVVVFTMEGCPYCSDFKNMLESKNIEFVERDIDLHESEYDMFVKITGNEMVPSLLIIEGDEKKHESFLYAPERDYNELTEAVVLIEKHREKFGII